MFEGKVSKSLLYENVVQKLIEMIDRGIVCPGGQFPPERELVEGMEVSRNVLREAFHILEERGIVTSIQGKGRFLRQIPDRRMVVRPTALELQRFTLLELYQVRRVLEQGAMDILVEIASEQDLNDLEEKFSELRDLFVKNQKTLGEFQMHKAYAEKTGNEYLTSLLQATTDRVLRIIWVDFSSVAAGYAIDSFIHDHTKILSALRARDAIAARGLMRSHLDETSDRIETYQEKANR